MQTKRYVIERLLGMQPWRTPGSSELRPRILERFSFSRPEGYETVDQNPISSDPDDWLSPDSPDDFASVIGRDGTGLASILRSDDDLAITRRLSLLGSASPGTLGGDLEYAHIPAFGAYASINHYAGIDLDDDVFGPEDIEDLKISVTELGTGGGDDSGVTPSGTGDVPAYAGAACYHSGSEEWMAAAGDQVFHSENYLQWDETAYTLPASATWRHMVSDGNTILLVGNGGAAYFSEDDGATWAACTGLPSADLSDADVGDGRWVVVQEMSGNLFYSDGPSGGAMEFNACSDETDGGGWFEDWDFRSVCHDAQTGVWAAGEGSDNAAQVWSFDQAIQHSANGVTWNTGPGLFRSGTHNHVGIASNGEGVIVAVGDIANGVPDGVIRTSQDGGYNYGYITGRYNLQRVAWTGAEFVAIGYGSGAGDTTIVRSSDGLSWSDESDRYNVGNMQLWAIATGPSGEALAWAKNSDADHPFVIVTAGGGIGGDPTILDPGDYEVIWLAVVPTRSGKVVVSSGTQRWAQRGGTQARATVTAPAAPSVLDGNLRYEVYIRYAPEEEDEATGQYVTDDITGREYVLSLVIDAGESDESLPYPEIGRTLPDVGNVGTVALSGVATYHQDRIWYKPASLEEEYGFLRGEPAIDSLSRPMAIGFSELEYLNLTGESFYLHLPPGNSTEVTAIVSSPSGLMVFGDNDAYLVSGDPAIENSLNVEPFPDSVGCDEGFVPATLAGLVFVVWRNRLYALDGAQAQDISWGVLDKDSTIRDIATDAATNTIAVMTDEAVLHYDLEKSEWYQSEYFGDYDSKASLSSQARLLPSPTGLCFFSVESGTGAIVTYDEAGSPSDQPSIIEWRGLDAGDSLRRDYWRYVRIPVDVEADEFEIDESSIDATLYWRTRPEQPPVEEMDSGYAADGHILNGELVFQIPWGYPSRHIDLRLVLAADQRVAIQPGISIGYAPGPQGDLIPSSEGDLVI